MTVDQMVLMIIIAFFILLFVILGFVFISGKSSNLIAGYNTMSPEEKNKYNTVTPCKFIGKMKFALSFSMLFRILSIAYEVNWPFEFVLVMFIGIVVFTLIYVNTVNRVNPPN